MKVANKVEKRWYEEMAPLLYAYLLNGFEEWVSGLGIEHAYAKVMYILGLLKLNFIEPATIDPSVSEFYFEDDSFVKGKCAVCGALTEGVVDNVLTPADYEYFMAPEHIEDWRCAKCMWKEELEDD